MANKLYEEESIRAIANTLRQNDPRISNGTFTVGEMPRAIESVVDYQYEAGDQAGYSRGYNNGHTVGLTEGAEKVKTEEARDDNDIYTIVEADNKNVEVTVTGGYYSQETVRNVNVESVYEAGHTEGYNEGYEEGLADGGGGSGGNSEVDEMMLLDEWHDWEGEPPFYSYYKYLYYEVSSLSSAPVVVSLENGNESKYLHVYIYAYLNGSAVGGNDEEAFYTVVLPPADEAHDWYSFDSLEINSPCFEVRVWGIRWSDDGV